MIVSVPASARGEEPVTGASSMRHAALRQGRADRAACPAARSSTVHAQQRPRGAASITPFSSSSTDDTCAPSTTMLTTTSLAPRDLRRGLGGALRRAPPPIAPPCQGCASRPSARSRPRDVRRHARAHDPQAQKADPLAGCRRAAGVRSAHSCPNPPPPGVSMRSRCARSQRAGRSWPGSSRPSTRLRPGVPGSPARRSRRARGGGAP